MLTPFQSRAARALAAAPVFGRLGEAMSALAQRRVVKRGETLFEKGDPASALFGIVSGRMKVFCATQAREVALELLGVGDVLAALELSCGGPQHTSARAMTHAELVSIDRAELEALFEQQPELRAELGAAASRAVGQLTERAVDVAFLTLELRLEKVLSDLADRIGESVGREDTRLPLRQQDLADILGVSRETVNRALAAPPMRDRIMLQRGSITLVRHRVGSSEPLEVG